MKTRFNRLAFAAMLLSSTGIAQAEQGASSVGDVPGYGEVAYFHEDATYAENAEISAANHVGDLPVKAPSAASKPGAVYPSVSAAQLQAASHATMGSYDSFAYSCDNGCDGPCDGGCDSACGKKSCLADVFRLFDGCDCDGWATAEALMWFAPDRNMPALITTSDPGTFPILPDGGINNVQTVFGDDIDGEISGGFRLDIGTYVNEHLGIGGRLWWMADNNDSYAASGDGSDRSIGRPFYNTEVPSNDALLVAFDPTFTGTIAAQSELKVWGGELYARGKLACRDGCRVDVIGGYSHFEIDDTLAISSATVTNATARIRQYLDLFDTDNRFDGGQVGFETVLSRGRWSLRSLTKVHLGNMRQQVRIFGISSDRTPPAAGNVTSGGLLAMGNQGDRSRDVFSFIPEANIKLGYRVRDNISLSVGYSFLYFDNVALVGDVIDTSVDGSTINTGVFGNRPEFNFNDSSLWVQGVDFGVQIEI